MFHQQHSRCDHCTHFVDNSLFSVHVKECRKREGRKRTRETEKEMKTETKTEIKTQEIDKTNELGNGKMMDGKKCEECGLDGCVVVKCKECEQELCAECDGKVHSKGARVRHVRERIILEQVDTVDNELSRLNQNEIVEKDDDMNRVACSFCGRKFSMIRVAAHENVCAKPKKVRKKWDEGKQRIEGTDFQEFKNHRSQTPEHIRKERLEGTKWRAERDRLKLIIEDGNKYIQEKKDALRMEIEKQLEAQEKFKKEQASLPTYARGPVKKIPFGLEKAPKVQVQPLGMGKTKADAFSMNFTDSEVNLRQQVLNEILAKKQGAKPSQNLAKLAPVPVTTTKSSASLILGKKSEATRKVVSNGKGSHFLSASNEQAGIIPNAVRSSLPPANQPFNCDLIDAQASTTALATVSSIKTSIPVDNRSSTVIKSTPTRTIISSTSRPSSCASGSVPLPLPPSKLGDVPLTNLISLPKASSLRSGKDQISLEDYRQRETLRRLACKSGAALLPTKGFLLCLFLFE